MNALKNFLVEIHNVEVCNEDWAKGKKFLIVDITVNCYGSIDRGKYIFEEKEWEEIVKKNYFMA